MKLQLAWAMACLAVAPFAVADPAKSTPVPTTSQDAVAARVYDVKEVDQKPKMVKSAPAMYPRRFLQEGVSGRAVIEFIVRRDGKVTDAKVIDETAFGFGAAAKRKFIQSTFKPALVNGQPVDCRMRLPLQFGTNAPGRTTRVLAPQPGACPPPR